MDHTNVITGDHKFIAFWIPSGDPVQGVVGVVVRKQLTSRYPDNIIWSNPCYTPSDGMTISTSSKAYISC